MRALAHVSAFGAVTLASALLLFPACHPVGACDNCNPSTEYCAQACNIQGVGPAQCEPIPTECVPTATCACLGSAYIRSACGDPAQPNCVMFNTWSCDGDAKNGFFFQTQPSDVSHCP